MFERLARLTPQDHRPHALHAAERIWPETNCYVDLWIEVLAALGLEPQAMLGFTLTQDFEGDQFTFFKVPLQDLERLYGIRVSELAIFEPVEAHVATQIARGRLCLVEVDSFFLPDTQGVSYRTTHGKTTIAITALDAGARILRYFHNGGFFELSDDDFDDVFQRAEAALPLPFLPYTEFAKFPPTPPSEDPRRTAIALLRTHLAGRPPENPFRPYRAVFEAQIAALADRPFDAFHAYAFNTLRQAGANFELAASHLDWLAPGGALAGEAAAARRIAETCKTVQFQLARALARRRFAGLAAALEPAEAAWDALIEGLGTALAGTGLRDVAA